MRALTAEEIRGAFVNLPAADAVHVPLPGLHEVVWEDREFLGWLDPSLRGRGYLVQESEEGVIGIVLRSADGPRAAVPAMCSLCRATQPATQVSLWSAARAGQAGRDGASVGTYICDDLGCPRIIRMLPPSSPWAPAPGDLLEARSAGLTERLRSFTESVLRASR